MRQFIFMAAIELALLLGSALLLMQPKTLFRVQTERTRYVATYSGMVLLCLVFCWSVIFGCFYALYEFTVRL